MRQRGEKIHERTATLAGRLDAAYGDQSTMGERRLGNITGLMFPTLRGPCHIILWTSKCPRKLVKSSLGVEVYAFCDMLDRTSMIRGLYAHSLRPSPKWWVLRTAGAHSHTPRMRRLPRRSFLGRRFLNILFLPDPTPR